MRQEETGITEAREVYSHSFNRTDYGNHLFLRITSEERAHYFMKLCTRVVHQAIKKNSDKKLDGLKIPTEPQPLFK